MRTQLWFALNEIKQGNTPIFHPKVYAVLAAVVLLIVGTGWR